MKRGIKTSLFIYSKGGDDMTRAGYLFIAAIGIAGAVYTYFRMKYRQKKPKDLYHQAKKDFKKK
jgi:hypothetical protein